MIYIILLLILAVLLFGSSAVLGALGAILGLIVAAIALVAASVYFSIPVEVVFMILLGLFFAIIIVGKIADAKYTDMLGGEQGRADYEKLLAETKAKMEADKKAGRR